MTDGNRRSSTVGRGGFTLIELLIVVVIIGVLAAIALPKFGTARERSYISGMKSDLRNLQTAMEMYYHSNLTSYAGATLGTVALPYSPRPPVTINLTTTKTGWSAVANHPSVSESCAIYIGTAEAVAPATEEGRIMCGVAS